MTIPPSMEKTEVTHLESTFHRHAQTNPKGLFVLLTDKIKCGGVSTVKPMTK